MGSPLLAAAFLLLFAMEGFGQVRVEAHLERTQYLQGEPIVIILDMVNVGDEPVGYSQSDGDVKLTVVGVQRRGRPNIFGCYSGIGEGGASGSVDHPPLLAPGQAASFRYLLREYDLSPGRYSVAASGKAGARWKYYPSYGPNVAPAPPPKHKETDPVPGAQFEQTLSLTVVPSGGVDLQRAFAQLISDADSSDPILRYQARSAIIESAPRFLESSIARFAREDRDGAAAIDALGRIATTDSRTHLRALFQSARGFRRSAVVLALARIGNRDDASLLAGVLEDAANDEPAREYAALGLAHIGGNEAVGDLQRALAAAAPEIRPSIARALGNTRSRLAVPVLISMWGNNSTRNDVCSGLLTLTHRSWCRGVVDDPAATRRQWLREWKANGSKTAIYGPDECLGEPAVAAADQPETRPATPDSAAVADAPRPNPDRVPAAIPEPPDTIPVLERISPARPHPAQIVFVQTRPPAYVGDYVELTDAVAHVWRIPTGVSGSLVLFKLPDEVADGEAAVRVGRTRNGVDHFSAPLKFVATSGPSPLPPFAASMTYPVAPGQWTDLVVDADVEFEISRADRIDVEFSQGHRTIVTRPTGPDRVHVQVPRALSPGLIHVRTRTWIERKPSEWSVATDFDALEHLVAPSVTSIEAGPLRNLVWWAGDRSPAFASAKHGEALVLRGHFPVARAADLRIQLHGATPVVALSATDVEGGVRIELPKNVTTGDWRLFIGTAGSRAEMQELVTVRVR